MTLKHIMRRTFVPILNIIGMSISLMVFIVLFAQVWFDYRFNRNFEDYKNIYRGGDETATGFCSIIVCG